MKGVVVIVIEKETDRGLVCIRVHDEEAPPTRIAFSPESTEKLAANLMLRAAEAREARAAAAQRTN